MKLFDTVGLRAQAEAGARSKRKKYNQKVEDAISDLAQRRGGKTKKELVGDGEEVEVDSTEELSDNDLNLIYQKCVPILDKSNTDQVVLVGPSRKIL